MTRRPLQATAALLLASGALLSGRAVYLRAKGALAHALIRRAWTRTVQTGHPVRPWPGTDALPCARLRIPSLGVDSVVLQAASPRVLAFGPARMMNSAAPGEPGNVVLAGHRTTDFLPLERVAAGDVMILEWVGGDGRPREGRYRVIQRAVVDPHDTRGLRQTPDERLTLITCYPFGRGPGSPQRYVVQGARI